MVTVKHFSDATSKEYFTYDVDTVADFLRSSGLDRTEMQSLRFFHTDTLGQEIDTSDLSFLDINEGVIVAIDGKSIPEGPETWIYISIAIITAVVVSSLVDIPNAPNTGNTSRSSTNSLGATNNTNASVNDRIDDIFGTVNYHVPKLWQYPYRVGINDQETEFQLLCVGRGKYDIDMSTIREDITSFSNIPNAEANIYEPGTWPGNGSPSQVLNNVITRPIGVYRESSSINATELLPPNDLSLGQDAIWSVTGDGSEGVLTLDNAGSLDVDLQDYFSVGENVTLIECWTDSNNTQSIDREVTLQEGDTPTDDTVSAYIAVEISGTYEILNVTSTTITLDSFTHDVRNGSNIKPNLYSWKTTGGTPQFVSVDSSVIVSDVFEVIYKLAGTSTVIVYSTEVVAADVGQSFDNVVGIFTLPKDTTSVLINLTSASGFYKIYKSTEVSISADVRIIIEETDSNGDVTGNQIVTNYNYTSNPGAVTASVYRTVEIDIPYQYSRIYAFRTGLRDKGENITNVDKIEWTYLYTYEPNPVDTDFGDVTLLYVLIPSNSQSRLIKQRKTNLDLTRKVTQYLGNGTFGPTESYPTDSFDQILIHTALDPWCGRLTLDDINADSWLLVRQQIVDYFGDSVFTEFGYDFDNTQMSYDDMFTLITKVVNCIPYVQGGKYDLFFDGEQTESQFQITCRNKIPDSETREDVFENQYDSVELTFRNNETGDSEVIYVPSDGSGRSPQTIEIPGCPNEEQATVIANRLRNRQLYELTTVTFDVDEFGRMIVPGQRIDSPDSTRFVNRENATDGYRIYDGEVVEVNGLTLELSEPVSFVDGEDHYIQFTNVHGENSELIQCTPGENEFFVVLVSPPVESVYDGYDRDRTKFTFCSEQVRESIALIPRTIEVTIDSEGKETSTITSKNYDSRIYQNDPRGDQS